MEKYHPINKRVLKHPESCKNFCAIYHGDKAGLKQAYKGIKLLNHPYSVYDVKEPGLYAEPFSMRGQNYYFIRCHGVCPHRIPFGWYRGRGGYECSNEQAPKSCEENFKDFNTSFLKDFADSLKKSEIFRRIVDRHKTS